MDVCNSRVPVLTKRAVKFFLPFTTTYLCESSFSHVTDIKTKQRNCMLTPILSVYLCLSLSKSSRALTCLLLRDKFIFRTKCFLSIFRYAFYPFITVGSCSIRFMFISLLFAAFILFFMQGKIFMILQSIIFIFVYLL